MVISLKLKKIILLPYISEEVCTVCVLRYMYLVDMNMFNRKPQPLHYVSAYISQPASSID